MKESDVSERVMGKNIDAVLQEVLQILEEEDGRPFEEKKAAVVERLRNIGDTALGRTMLEKAIMEKEGEERKVVFWQGSEIICSDGKTVLRNVCEADRELFIAVRKEYFPFKTMLNDDAFGKLVWQEHISGTALMCSIIHDGEYVGYCGIHDIWRKPWEIAIELLPQWTGHGIGNKAITAMLREISERMGVSEFKARIEPGNTASRKLFERLGAKPKRIVELHIHDPAVLEQIEEENLSRINDELVEVANIFGVEPRKLLSHVLEYSLTWDVQGTVS